MDAYSPDMIKALLAARGITLRTDAEYSDVAFRVQALVEGICALMADLPERSDALIPPDGAIAEKPEV